MTNTSMKLFTTTLTQYLTSFSHYIHPLLYWGHWLFISLLTINIVWMALWYAFDQEGFDQALSIFIRKFFVISIFYTLMIHPDWFTQLLQTSEYMGGTLTKLSLTPQAIIQEGIQLSNQLMSPLDGENLLTGGSGFIIALLASLLVLWVFLSVTLDLLVTLLSTTFLISMASFFLGIVPQSETVARQTLNTILQNCMKLFGLYVVIALGLSLIKPFMGLVPTQYNQLDPYVWISAEVLLFWFLSKKIPQHLSHIMAGFVEKTASTTRMINQTNNNQSSPPQAISTHENVCSTFIPSLAQTEKSPLTPLSITPSTHSSNGNLSSQFSQLGRKLATHSKMKRPHQNKKKLR